MYPIQKFCDKFHACRDGMHWALANCKSMQEVWDTSPDNWLMWIATRPKVLTNRNIFKTMYWILVRLEKHLEKHSNRDIIYILKQHYVSTLERTEIEKAHTKAWDIVQQMRNNGDLDNIEAARAGAIALDFVCGTHLYNVLFNVSLRVRICINNEEFNHEQSKYLRDNFKPNFEEEKGHEV